MTEGLKGRRILVVEDEYLIADELCRMLATAGAEVIGPTPNVASALEVLKSEAHLDGAVLDVNLQGETAYPIADLLAEKTIPFAFATGYDQATLPERFSAAPLVEKPVQQGALERALSLD